MNDVDCVKRWAREGLWAVSFSATLEAAC